MDLSKIHQLKLILREDSIPFFSDEELDFYLNKNNGDLNDTVYECCLIKAEDTTLNIAGMSTSDSSRYFLRLAQHYRNSNSGILEGN